MTQISNDEKARAIIEKEIYMTLATCDKKSKPWAAPLYYAYDNDYNFYFVSAKDSLHANHIMENPSVAIAIFDSTVPAGEGDGVQIEGTAKALGILELPKAMLVYFSRRFRDPKERALHGLSAREYLGINLFRFFKVEVVKAYTLDLTVKDVDKRVEVQLKK